MQYKPCICQRMYDTGESGVYFIDQWMSTLDWPADWYAQVYHGQTDELDIPLELARKLKWRIEQNCTASIHYPSLLLDDMYGGRPVYASQDEEKQEENRESLEHLLWLACNPAEARKHVEYRGSDAGAGNSDVLQRQREDGNFNNPTAIDRKEADVQETLNLDIAVAHATKVERRALSRIRKEEPSPWDTLVWRNKARIRAKEEQARRNLWFICKREGWTDDPEKLADIKRRVEESGYAATLKVIREGFRALAVA